GLRSFATRAVVVVEPAHGFGEHAPRDLRACASTMRLVRYGNAVRSRVRPLGAMAHSGHGQTRPAMPVEAIRAGERASVRGKLNPRWPLICAAASPPAGLRETGRPRSAQSTRGRASLRASAT